jgi:hypothetical protein
VTDEVACAHPNNGCQSRERVTASDMGHHIILDSGDRRRRVSRRGQVRTEL